MIGRMTASFRPLLILLFGAALYDAAAQSQPHKDAAALASWIALDAPPAEEHLATDALLRQLPGWARDANGNLWLRKGSGRPRRVVACGLDYPGLVVSEITDAGYLRLHRAGRPPVHPLWDQSHEGQRIEVMTRAGRVPGVVAIANGHFARQHAGDTAVANVDRLWVDVGARSRAEAERLGIALLDPVARDLPAWPYAGHVSGAGAGLRVGCAAVAAAASSSVQSGETTFLITTQRSFNWAGLGSALARMGRVEQIAILERGEAVAGTAPSGVIRRRATL